MLNRNLRYTVVGLGKTGRSCVDFLIKNNCRVAVVDDGGKPEELDWFLQKHPTVPITFGEMCVPPGTDVIVLSPGVSAKRPAIAAAKASDIPIIGDIELFVQQTTTPIIAVTGTNGKSTVVTLISKMIAASKLKVGLGGNIGVPALSLLDDKYDFYVLELSSFQLDVTYSLAAHVAVILNITPDHLDRHGSMEAYINAKSRIHTNAKHVIVYSDDPLTYLQQNKQPYASFGLQPPTAGNFGLTVDKDGVTWLSKGINNPDMPVCRIDAKY